MMGLLTVLSLTLLLSRALPTHGFLTVETIHDTPTYHTTETKDAGIRVVYEAVRSSCHAEGRAFQCMPPFTNVAEGATVEATSTCGTVDNTEQFCIPRTDNTGRIQPHCEPCTPPDRFHAAHLTDRHQMHNETYWVSGAVSPGQTVNLTMSLGKTFEVYYISLQPYGRLPDAITLSKSSDFGKTWQPWQYFSTDCYRAFRLPTSNEHNAQISAANIQEVLCVALKPSETHETVSHAAKMIAFSTTIGRPSSQPWSAGLVDWMTMTDLKVTLARFHDQHLDSTQHDAGGLLLTPNLLTPANVFRVGDTDRSKMASGTLGMSRHQFQSDATTGGAMKSMHFAFSDLAIGGRCKCNGHANRCVRDRVPDAESKDQNEWGPLRCDCQHNTAGTDCEKCAPGHLDRPWARASSEAVNECKLAVRGGRTCFVIYPRPTPWASLTVLYMCKGEETAAICAVCQPPT
ncbi:hypothetical protein AHF37_00322 [Paragonimus kellicotti]|nr:hypothetical protein AHF37_00322 [Paragonimus kellicotti]